MANAAFQIIQGGVIPMDITTVETADKQTLYMTILSGWGLISDIDIESESLRRIGESRFVLGETFGSFFLHVGVCVEQCRQILV